MNAKSSISFWSRHSLIAILGATFLMMHGSDRASAAGYWKSDGPTSGSDAPLCKALYKRLNRMNKQGTCGYNAITTYPAFSAPPWRDLDEKEHLDLLVKLFRYQQEGVGQYFNGPAQMPESAYHYRANEFIKAGGELKVWRTRLVDRLAAGTRQAAPGWQTVLQLALKIPAGARALCPGKVIEEEWARWTSIVLPDLSGPDPQIDAGTASQLSSHWIVMFEGAPLLINSTSVAHTEYGMCDFEFVKQRHPSKHFTPKEK